MQLQRLRFRLVTVPPIKYSSLCFQVREEKTNAATEVQSASVALWGSAATTWTLEGGEATKKPEMRSNQEGAAQRMQPTSSLER